MPLHINVAVKVVTVVSASCVLLHQLNHRHHHRGIPAHHHHQQQQQQQHQHSSSHQQRHNQGEQPAMMEQQPPSDWSSAMAGQQGLYPHLATVTATATVAYDAASAHVHTDMPLPAYQRMTSAAALEHPLPAVATSNSGEGPETMSTSLTSPVTQATSFTSSSSSDAADLSEADLSLHESDHSLYLGAPTCAYQNNYAGYATSVYMSGNMNCEDTSRCFALARDGEYGHRSERDMVNDVVSNLGDVGSHFADSRHHEEGQHLHGDGSCAFPAGSGVPVEALYPSGWQEQFGCYPQSKQGMACVGYGGNEHGDRTAGIGEKYGGITGPCEDLATMTQNDYMTSTSLTSNASSVSFSLPYSYQSSAESFCPTLQEAPAPLCALRLPEDGTLYGMQHGFQNANHPFHCHHGHNSSWYETDTDERDNRNVYQTRTAFLDSQCPSTRENKELASFASEAGKQNDTLKCQTMQIPSATRNYSQEMAVDDWENKQAAVTATQRDQCRNTQQHSDGSKDKKSSHDPDTCSPLFSSLLAKASHTTSTSEYQAASSSQSSSVAPSASDSSQPTTMPQQTKMAEQQQSQACHNLRSLAQEFPDQFSHIPSFTPGSRLQSEKEDKDAVHAPYQTNCRYKDALPLPSPNCPGKTLSKSKANRPACSFEEPSVNQVISVSTPPHSESALGVAPTSTLVQSFPMKGGASKASSQSSAMKGMVSTVPTQALPTKSVASTTPTQSLPTNGVVSTTPPTMTLKGAAAGSTPTAHSAPGRVVAPSSTATPSLPMQCDPKHIHPSPLPPLLPSKSQTGNIMPNDDLPISPASSTTPPIDVDHLLSTGVTVAGFKPRPIIRKRRKVMIPMTQKDVDYWRKRKKNNDSAKRSREAKKEKEKNFYRRALELEYENYFLKERLAHAEAQLHALTGISPAPHEYSGPVSHEYAAGNTQSDAVFM